MVTLCTQRVFSARCCFCHLELWSLNPNLEVLWAASESCYLAQSHCPQGWVEHVYLRSPSVGLCLFMRRWESRAAAGKCIIISHCICLLVIPFVSKNALFMLVPDEAYWVICNYAGTQRWDELPPFVWNKGTSCERIPQDLLAVTSVLHLHRVGWGARRNQTLHIFLSHQPCCWANPCCSFSSAHTWPFVLSWSMWLL